MNAIYSLWSALANLARALNRLAAVADVVAGEAERRIELPLAAAPEALALSLPQNGEVEGKITRTRK